MIQYINHILGEQQDEQQNRHDKSTQVYTEHLEPNTSRAPTSIKNEMIFLTKNEYMNKQANAYATVNSRNFQRKKCSITHLDFRSRCYRNVITSSKTSSMNELEKRVHDFLKSMVDDYEELACNSLEKCSRKDLEGTIKVYTKKPIQYEYSNSGFFETKDAQTQTRYEPNYKINTILLKKR